MAKRYQKHFDALARNERRGKSNGAQERHQRQERLARIRVKESNES